MTRENLYSYICNIDTIETASRLEIESLLDEYPYFQTVRLLLLKYLSQTDNEAFLLQLSESALLCADRTRLFYLIMHERFADFIKENEREYVDKESLTTQFLDSFFEKHNKREPLEGTNEIPSVLNKEFGLISTDYIRYLDTMLPDDKLEETTNPTQLKHQSIIDRFIARANSEQRFLTQPIEEEKSTPEHTYQIEDDDTAGDVFLTETLAQIYIKQKKYEQALSIFKRLNLNFPEKSVYFADQIRFLEYLIHNEQHKK